MIMDLTLQLIIYSYIRISGYDKILSGKAIAENLMLVANPPGEKVSDLGEGLKLVREGKDIDYQGASGPVDFDQNGDVSGDFTVWSVAEKGTIKSVKDFSLKTLASGSNYFSSVSFRKKNSFEKAARHSGPKKNF